MFEGIKWVDIGLGDEAVCYRDEDFKIVKRVNHSITGGREVFLKHRAARALDDYFVQRGFYTINHVPEPLGYFENGYYYKYAKGKEGFPWEVGDEPCDLEERKRFNGLFLGAGFRVSHDIVDTDGNVGKNIILEDWSVSEIPDFQKYWMRIDFGSKSCPFESKKFKEFFEQHRADLEEVLGQEIDYLISFLNSLRE